MRRTAWLQVMSKAPQEHAQVMTAVWGTMLNVSPLDNVGHSRPDAHRYTRMSQRDLELVKGNSGTETVFEVWKGDWREMFQAGETAVEFGLTDPRLLRVAFCSAHSCCRIKNVRAQRLGRENLRGTVSRKRFVRISCGLLLWTVVTG